MIEVNSNEEAEEIAQREINKNFDVDNNLPYKLSLYNNTKSKFGQFVILSFDHSFSDGLGIISLILGLADNYSEKLFPFNKKYSWMHYLLNMILLPINLAKLIIITLKLNKQPAPMKIPFNHKKVGITKIATIVDKPFDEVSQVCKNLKITFNDLLITLVSKVLNTIQSEVLKVPKNKSFVLSIPIGLRSYPKNLKDLTIENSSPAFIINLQTVDDVERECRSVSKVMNSTFKNLGMVEAMSFILLILTSFIPYKLMNYIFTKESRNCDFLLSNVPCTKEALYYNGNKCESLLPFISTGFFSSFFACLTYDKKVTYLFSVNEKMPVGPEVIKKYFEIEYYNLIHKKNN